MRRFQAAMVQARRIARCRTEAGKRRSALLWCQKVLQELKE
jgi:hypothetical protein